MKKMMIPVILGLFLFLGIGSNVFATIELKGTVAGGDVDVFANFFATADSLSVQVWNATSNPSNVGQNISDLSFALSTGQTTGTLTSSLGLKRSVSDNGTFADGGSRVDTGWGLVSFGDGLRLYVLGTTVAPENTILGLPDGTYSNANGSIAGNAPHNPFLFGTEAVPVTFELSIPGVTRDTTISNVVFSFGTSEGSYLTQVPEPATLLLLGLGLVGLAGVKRKFNK